MTRLLCETNTRAVERRIRGAFRAEFRIRSFETDYEHGQWWVTVTRTGAQYSVYDSVPGPFSFEQVSEGDEE